MGNNLGVRQFSRFSRSGLSAPPVPVEYHNLPDRVITDGMLAHKVGTPLLHCVLERARLE